MRNILLSFIITIIAVLLCCCEGKKENESKDVLRYTDIPGITETEIAAVQSIAARNRPIAYGALPSTEAFIDNNGVLAGYTQRLCELLTSLFGIRFTLALHDWDAILAGLADGSLDFSGDLIPTPARRGKYHMSDAIAERSINIFKKKGAADIGEIAKKRPPKLAFLTGSVHIALFREVYADPFDLIYVDNFETAAAMLHSELIDAFINESVSDSFFIEYGFVESRAFFPLVYIPVSLATQKEELQPLIGVINKYLEHGGQKELARLYAAGEADYKKYGLFKAFSATEREYIEHAVASGREIPVVLESDNYPVSFFNHATNKFEGIVVDILEAVSGITGLRFKTINRGGAKWEDILASLVSGEAALISELMYSEARKGKFLWTEQPFCTTSYAFISKAAFPDLEIYQVMSQKVGVIKGTAYEEMYNKWFPDNKTVPYDSGDLAFEALERDEITLILAAESLLLTQTNYREKPGYKVNIDLNHPIEAKFGFNSGERDLCSIIGKAQGFIKTDMIAKRWFGKVFDYSAELSKTRVYLLLICIALLLAVLGFIVFFFLRNRIMRKKLEELVSERTIELRRQMRVREAAEREALVASGAKSSFLARMSHEIRTPLNAIIGMSEIARKASADNDKALGAINRILASSHHLLGILNDILDMAKIESGKMELADEPFILGEAVAEVSDIILARCADKNIDFSVAMDGLRDRVVTGDKLRLNQVLINLLGNAVKFTDPDGHIGVSITLLTETDEALLLAFTVKDSGIGMTEEQIARLFMPFEQADASIASRFGGTGLGLSISKNLINAMGGDISVTSAPGRGTAFRFELLMAKGRNIAVEAPEPGEVADLRGVRILLVEDIEVNRIIIEELFSSSGAHIESAVNGSEAVAMFGASPEKYYRLIFMDIQMPEMDGYEATEKIRAMPRPDARQIPVIAMTANAYREDVERAMAAGMDGHLAKPINVASLFKTVAHHLGPDGKDTAC